MEVSFKNIDGPIENSAPVQNTEKNTEESTAENQPEKQVDLRTEFFKQAILGKVALSGRTFRFKSSTAFDGCAIYNYLCSYRAPFGSAASDFLLPAMPPAVLQQFMKLVLKNCSEDLPDCGAPVVDEDGGIGINNASGPLLSTLTDGYVLFFAQNWARESPLASGPED